MNKKNIILKIVLITIIFIASIFISSLKYNIFATEKIASLEMEDPKDFNETEVTKTVGLMENLRAISNFDINVTANTEGYGSVSLDWSDYDYIDKNFKVYKSSDGGKTYETVGIDYTLAKEIKCLQIYPISNASNQLKTWIETNGYGKGLIKIDSVYIDTFNSNPNSYLKDSNGDWKYDVIFFGTWDGNNAKDLNATSKTAVEEFIKSGKGCIMGHDIICAGVTTATNNFSTLKDYFGIYQDTTARRFNGYDSSTTSVPAGNSTVIVSNKGLFTTYPWNIGEIGTKLTIPGSHSNNQYASKASIWLRFFHSSYTNSDMSNPVNFYLATYNNCAIVQTGHSNGAATVDEQKILANLIFYCNQLIFNTYHTIDSSAQDVAVPNAPSIKLEGKSYNFSATDNGSQYYYYVESYSKNDTTETGILDKSVTKSVTVTTGVKSYIYVYDNEASTIVTTENGISTTSNIDIDGNYKYIHVAAVDGAGNISDTTTIELPNKYTVKYNGNGATEGSTADSSHMCDVSQNLNANGFEKEYVVTFKHNYESSNDVEKIAKYTFKSWNTKEDGTGTDFNDSSEVKNLTQNDGEVVNLYAMWNPSSVSYVPTREGYTFEGWYSDEECTNKVTDNEYTPTEDTMLYAKWKENINLEEKISIELTKKWVDNNIQALRRPDKIKFIVTQYKEITENVITESEEIISNENTEVNDKIEDSINKTEESDISNIEEQVEENIKDVTKVDEETSNVLEEKAILENAYSTELQKSSMINEISEPMATNNLNTELNQEDNSIANEEKLQQEESKQDDNSKSEQEEITQDNNILEETPTNSQSPEENNAINEEENIIDDNSENQPIEGTEKVEITTYEYTMIVDKDVNQQTFTLGEIFKYDKETEEEIKYIVTEVEVNEGDLKFYNATGGEVVQEADEEGNIKYSAEIVNTFKLPEENIQNITAIKAWNDNGKIETRPTSLILELIGRVQNIELVKESTEVTNEIVTTDYKDISSKEQIVSSTDDWKNTFTSVPIYDENGQEIEYTLQEKADEGVLDKYIADVSEVNDLNEITITNSLIIQDSKIEKNGTELVNAVDAKIDYTIDYTFELDSKYTENVNIELVDTLEYEFISENSETSGGRVGEDNKTLIWRGTYSPENKIVTWDNETENIQVEVTEDAERNIQIVKIHLEIGIIYKNIDVLKNTIENNIMGKITLSNNVTETEKDSFETETKWVKNVIVNKIWKGDTEAKRPDSIELQLLASTKDENGEDIEYALDGIETTKFLSEDTDWTATLWRDLPSYDETGKEIHYTINEVEVDGYKSEIIQIDESTSKVEILLKNTKWYKLPITGGIGVDTVRNLETLIGIIVLILITNRKKVVPTRRSKVEARKIKKLEKFAKMHNRK